MELNFSEFPETSYEQWRTEAEASLKGAPFDKKLVSKTPEGIEIQPIYNATDITGLAQVNTYPGFSPFLRGAETTGYHAWSWEVAQYISEGSARGFNSVARHDLSTGQTALRLSLDRASRLGLDPDHAPVGDVGFCGLSIASTTDVDKLLDGIDLEKTAVYFEGGSAGLVFLGMFVAVARERKFATEQLRGAIEQDPLSELVKDGALPVSMDRAYDDMAAVTRWSLRHLPAFQTIHASGAVFHDCGATNTQELAFAISSGVASLREMEKRGFSIDEVASRIRFTISMDSDFFMSIAKLRAARLLWSRIVAACGGNERSRRMRIHVRTALHNKTRLDPYVNMLRVTSEAFAAVLGGCESLQTGAFDEVIRPSDEFSRRIARNTQTILREECNLDRVIDPGGGSYYLEKLTDDFARKTWELFREIEAHGGILRALETGLIQNRVEESARKKAELVAHRRTSIIGTNVYANTSETPLDPGDWGLAALHKKRASEVEQFRTSAEQEDHTKVLAILADLASKSGEELVESVVAAAAHGATLGEISRALRPATETPISIRPIPKRRAASDFEELRAASARSATLRGRGPTVYLAGMGPLKQHKARADFSAGFFAAGGFEIISGAGFSSPEEAVNAAATSAADIVVICSTDETYPDLVPPIARGLKQAAPQKLVVLAGLPAPEVAEEFRQAGVDDFIHIRANCAEMLKKFLTHLGVYA